MTNSSRRATAYRTLTSRSGQIYLATTIGAASLALGQIVLFPIALSPSQLSILALGLSFTQAVLQFTDLGFGNASLSTQVSTSRSKLFRAIAVSASTFVSSLVMAVIIVVGVLNPSLWGIVGPLALAVVTGTILVAEKNRAFAAIRCGNNREALMRSFVWQNSPKFGQLLISWFGLAWPALLGGLATSLALTRLGNPRPLLWIRGIRKHHRACVGGFSVALFAFGLQWIDTYVSAILLGLAESGIYQAIYRPLLGITYIYIPSIGIIQSALHLKKNQRAFQIAVVTSIVCAVAAGTIALLLIQFGEDIWPQYTFPPVPVALLTATVIAMAISSLAGAHLLVLGRLSSIVAANFAAAVTLVALSLLLIPLNGISGAATAALSAWALAAAAQVAIIIKSGRLRGSNHEAT